MGYLYPWDFRGSCTGCPWETHAPELQTCGSPMDYSWDTNTHRSPVVVPYVSHGSPMRLPWSFHGVTHPELHQFVSKTHGSLMGDPRPAGNLREAHGRSLGNRWKTNLRPIGDPSEVPWSATILKSLLAFTWETKGQINKPMKVPGLETFGFPCDLHGCATSSHRTSMRVPSVFHPPKTVPWLTRELDFRGRSLGDQ